MKNLAIIVIGYNRSNALARLLESLSHIECQIDDVDLIISIEGSATVEVINVANEYEWNYGEKIIVKHEKRLGLRNHFIWVGDQTQNYKHVVFLEDDLEVSPYLLDAVYQLIQYYDSDERIAGYALYSPMICEFNARRFYQIEDGTDAYFLQHPYWGNVWEKSKWDHFKCWLKTYQRNDNILPIYARKWKDTSFKVVFLQYLVETKKYIVIPRISVVDNRGYAGTHNFNDSSTFSVPILLGKPNYRLCPFDNSLAVYDVNFEISDSVLKRENPMLQEYDFQVDLQDTQDTINKPYILTRKKSKKAILSFDASSKPVEIDVILNRRGNLINLVRSEDIQSDKDRIYRRWFDDIRANNITSRRYLIRMLMYSCAEAIKMTIRK